MTKAFCKHSAKGRNCPASNCDGYCANKQPYSLLLANALTPPTRPDWVMHTEIWRPSLQKVHEAAVELRRLHAENKALRSCAIKYMSWLNMKNPELALEEDLANPDMIS